MRTDNFIIIAVMASIILFCYSCQNSSNIQNSIITHNDTIQSKNEPELPKDFNQDTILITYQNQINEYRVQVKWIPKEAGCKFVEGNAIIDFYHESGTLFTIMHEFYFSDIIDFDKSNGRAIISNQRTYSCRYPKSKDSSEFNRSDVPFYFADLNFDGIKELILVSLCKDQRFRDSLSVYGITSDYKLVNKERQITDKEPYKSFDSQTVFNKNDKTVTVSDSGAADIYEERTYKYIPRWGFKLILINGVLHDSVYKQKF